MIIEERYANITIMVLSHGLTFDLEYLHTIIKTSADKVGVKSPSGIK